MVDTTFVVVWAFFFLVLIIYSLWDKIMSALFPQKKKSKPKVKVCPRCGGTKIKIPPAGMDIKMTLKDYCEECRMVGNFPQIDKSKKEEFRKQLKKWEEGK